jgi:hypothetical protein
MLLGFWHHRVRYREIPVRLFKASCLLAGLLALPAIASAQVLDLGGGGAFVNPITATNLGRDAGWFWDNGSSDARSGNPNCNAGFYALGTLSAGCGNQAAGTLANQGGFTEGFAAAGGLGPAPFMFSGSYGYNLTLSGALSAGISEIGIFTRTDNGQGGWNYNFTAIPTFGAKLVNSTFQIGGGSDWGFYIRNTFNPATGGCGGPLFDCSDATGGFAGASFQQFALFGGGGSSYLVGAEDNKLGLLGSGFDSDYNDYLIEVTVTPEPLSMALLASGLIGLAGAGYVQRRRRQQG